MILRYDKKTRSGAGDQSHGHRPGWKLFMVALALLLPAWLAAELVTHKVQKSETLYGLSKQYQVSIEQIWELNGLSSNNIQVGQVLKIKEADPIKPDFKTPPVTPTQSETPTPPPTSLEPPDHSQLKLPDDYYYTVQAGETAFRIATNHKLAPADFLRWNNLPAENPPIKPGDRLIIKDPASFDPAVEKPVEQGSAIQAAAPAKPDTLLLEQVYVVKKKDTLFSIAKAHGTTVDDIKTRNNLTSNDISVGQKLWLTGTPPADQASGSSSASSSTKVRTDCVMPTKGKVTSEFGMRRGRPHKGIDIANKSGTPIYAVLDGVVVFSGVQRGYGNVVLIEHPNFVMTVYAHHEKNLVKVGDHVKRGQQIARMGSTGNSTGPHLHFEYRVKGTAINPRKVLPF